MEEDEAPRKPFTDLKVLLHDQTTTVRGLLYSVQHLIDTLSPNPFRDDDSLEARHAVNIFQPAVKELRAVLQKSLSDIDTTRCDFGVEGETWLELVSLMESLEKWKPQETAHSLKVLHDIVDKIVEKSTRIETPLAGVGRAKERKREIQRTAKEVQRLLCLYDLCLEFCKAEEVYSNLCAAVRLLPSSPQAVESRMETVEVLIKDAIAAAMERISHIAERRGLKIQVRNAIPTTTLRTVPESLLRILQYLLDNALKFKGRLPEGSQFERPWVTVFVSERDLKVRISVESWGTPITEEEYNNGLLFVAGYRGRFAMAHGSDGTGTGLYEAKRLAKNLGGDIEIDTVPVPKTFPMNKFTKTTATIVLPLSGPL